MFAETLAGIALVKSAVDGIKSAIGTARDISEIADDIDKLFTGEQQIQKKKQTRRESTMAAQGSTSPNNYPTTLSRSEASRRRLEV